MRVADYIFKYLKEIGVKHIFLVVGGGSMYLNDAIKKSGIEYICFHHEQACAFAAEGYVRTSSKMAVICVTTGPGGTNALTGVIGAWLDSIPMLIISGQVKQETIKSNKLRQLGDQEIGIIDIVKSVTKYSKMITNPKTIKSELNKAVFIATAERPGPVWIDIPQDIQKSLLS